MTIAKGTALKTGYYTAESGDIFNIDEQALIDIAASMTEPVPFVNDHDDTVEIGVINSLSADGTALLFEATVECQTATDHMHKVVEQGGVPNVSIKMSPGSMSYTENYVDSSRVLAGVDWSLEHLSLVPKGRCDENHGCGVYAVQDIGSAEISNSTEDAGITFIHEEDDNMVEELETIKLELSDMIAKFDVMVAERDALKLELGGIETVALDAAKATLLETYPELVLSGVDSMEALDVVKTTADTGGIGVGDIIAVAGVNFLVDGQEVRLMAS